MKKNLESLTPEKRAKELIRKANNAKLGLTLYKLKLSDWRKYYEVFQEISGYDFIDMDLLNELLNANVNIRTEEEMQELEKLKSKLKESPSLTKKIN